MKKSYSNEAYQKAHHTDIYYRLPQTQECSNSDRLTHDMLTLQWDLEKIQRKTELRQPELSKYPSNRNTQHRLMSPNICMYSKSTQKHYVHKWYKCPICRTHNFFCWVFFLQVEKKQNEQWLETRQNYYLIYHSRMYCKYG